MVIEFVRWFDLYVGLMPSRLISGHGPEERIDRRGR